ncbi:FxDxF family PEP-CTERM protein [Burkholderiaceae bacterium UC74_6]
MSAKTLKTTLAAALLALVGIAQASPTPSSNSVVMAPNMGGGGFSAGISATKTVAGDFVDVFNLTGLEGWLQVDGLLKTLGTGGADIDFYSVLLNGHALELSQTAVGPYADFKELASLVQYDVQGPLVLTVSGHAGGNAADGTQIAASYSGSVNAMEIPEPASIGLVAIAAAGAAFAGRRRKLAR